MNIVNATLSSLWVSRHKLKEEKKVTWEKLLGATLAWRTVSPKAKPVGPAVGWPQPGAYLPGAADNRLPVHFAAVGGPAVAAAGDGPPVAAVAMFAWQEGAVLGEADSVIEDVELMGGPIPAVVMPSPSLAKSKVRADTLVCSECC